jgi:hypothetical protein
MAPRAANGETKFIVKTKLTTNSERFREQALNVQRLTLNEVLCRVRRRGQA